MSKYILEMKNISKTFPGVRALNNVNFSLVKGEIHAVCGENGAGKSTLMKVLSGVYPYGTYTGDIFVNDQIMEFKEISDSEKAGIAIIYQELMLIKEMDVAENIFLGKAYQRAGIINWDQIYYEAEKLINEIGLNIDMSSKIKDIGIGHQQLVEIAKALSLKADILILDEPTAALTETEVEILMEILNKLRSNGVSCILISHKLNEVYSVADRITILRDGETVGTLSISDITEEEVIRLMVGRELTQRFPEIDKKIGDIVFEVKNFTVYDFEKRDKKVIKNASFQVRKGEILGISGLMGAGRTELLSSIFGFMAGSKEGIIEIDKKIVRIGNPRDAIDHGMAMVSEDRKRYGLVLKQDVLANTTLSSLDKVSHNGVIIHDQEVVETTRFIDLLRIKTPGVDTIVNNLSGGNQQKVLLARCLMTKPKVLFLDEPTRGIDVGAKYEIYSLMNELAKNGTAIVMVSSELPEIIGMSDRVLVMHDGEINGEFMRSEINQEKLMIKASGG